MNPLEDALTNNPFADATSQSPRAVFEPAVSPSFQDGSGADTPVQEGVANLSLGSKGRSDSLVKQTVEIEASNAPNEDFYISVHSPVTIGEGGMKAHTTYSVTTKTTSPLFKHATMTVKRRFKEFLFTSQQLAAHNPGVIVPPAPEKSALGRFEEDFVENRRVLLERMLVKIARHPLLSKDPTFVSFLEADSFSTDAATDGKKKGSIMSLFGDLATFKIQETDDYFDIKKTGVDTLDTQLKSVSKSVDALLKQREAMSSSSFELGEAIMNLGQAEINKMSEKNLVSFAQVQKQLKDIYAEQAKMDLYHLGNTVDEYLRVIGSIRGAFESRVKAYSAWQGAEQTLVKARISLEKTRLNPKTKPEKIQQIETEILEGEQKVVTSKKEFEDITKLLKVELEAFEREKVVDVQACLKGFLKSVVETQKKIVTVWEEYLGDMELVSTSSTPAPNAV